jgi:hypothetical protein
MGNDTSCEKEVGAELAPLSGFKLYRVIQSVHSDSGDGGAGVAPAEDFGTVKESDSMSQALEQE